MSTGWSVFVGEIDSG